MTEPPMNIYEIHVDREKYLKIKKTCIVSALCILFEIKMSSSNLSNLTVEISFSY